MLQSRDKSKDNQEDEITTKNTKHDLVTPILRFIPIESLGGSFKFVYVFEFLPSQLLRGDLFHYGYLESFQGKVILVTVISMHR